MRGSLYDRYQLSNSTAIPQYQGSAGKEFIQVGDFMQGKYDQNLGQAMAINSGLENLDTTLPQDKKVADELRDHYSSKLKDLSKSGDWENMMPQVTQMGSEFANRYRELIAPMQQRAEFQKTLDDKEKNLTSQQKATLLKIADSEYQGLQKGPNGKLTGQYTGTRVDKNIDVNERVDKWMKDAAATSGGTITEGTNGQWLIKRGNKWETMTPQHIQQIIQPAAANDAEFQGYSDMMGRVGSHGLDKITDPALLKEGPIKAAAMKLVQEKGIPFGSALKQVAYAQTTNGVLSNALSYGATKYAKNNHWTSQEMKDDLYGVQEAKAKLDKDFTPTIIQGANSKTTNDEKDPEKLQKIADDFKSQSADLDGQITRLQKQLNDPNLNDNERAQTEADLNGTIVKQRSLQDGMKRSNDILDYSKLRTAKSMGYNNYQEFVDSQSKALVPELKKQIPGGIATKSGAKITPEELAQAISSGKVTPKFGSTMGGGYGLAGYSNSLESLDVTLNNGKKVTILPQHKGLEIYNLMQRSDMGKIGRGREFNNLWKAQHSANIENYSIQDNITTLDDAHAKDFTNALKAGADGVKFKKVGEYGELSESDRPADYRVTGLGSPGPNGEARLMVEEVDKNGKPTGTKYEANALNSNINEKMSRIYGKQPTVESKQAADILSTGAFSTHIKGQALGYKEEIGTLSDGTRTVVHVLGTESDPVYMLTDEKGNAIKNSQGEIIQSRSLSDVNRWHGKITGKKTYTP